MRSGKHDVLEDVGDTGGIAWRRREEHRKPVVVVGTLDVDVVCAGPLMLELEVRAFESFEGLTALDRVAADRA